MGEVKGGFLRVEMVERALVVARAREGEEGGR